MGLSRSNFPDSVRDLVKGYLENRDVVIAAPQHGIVHDKGFDLKTLTIQEKFRMVYP